MFVHIGHTTKNSARICVFLKNLTRKLPSNLVMLVSEHGSDITVSSTKVNFSANGVFVYTATSLKAARSYNVKILKNGTSTAIKRGSFRTLPETMTELHILTFSCNRIEDDPEHKAWHKLFDVQQKYVERNAPFMLLHLGDQIYEDGIERDIKKHAASGGGPFLHYNKKQWNALYAELYRQHWSPKYIRRVLATSPSYMIVDDHDILDDLGSLAPENFEWDYPMPVRGAWPERVKGALTAYTEFQKCHNPIMSDPHRIDFEFSFGPVPIFVFDLRTQRALPPWEALGFRRDGKHAPRITWDPKMWSPETPHTILGKEQFQRIVSWIDKVQQQTQPLVVLGCSIPLAFIPIEKLMQLMTELRDKADDDMIFKLLFWLNPEKKVWEKFGEQHLLNKLDHDLADHWTWGPHLEGLGLLLEQLFRLVDNEQKVVVLGGDVHFAAIHTITRVKENQITGTIHQITASGISSRPATDEDPFIADIVQRIKETSFVDGKVWSKLLKKTKGKDDEALRNYFRNDVLGSGPAHFKLCSVDGVEYWSTIKFFSGNRNFGAIDVLNGDVYLSVYDEIDQHYEIKI